MERPSGGYGEAMGIERLHMGRLWMDDGVTMEGL